MSLWKSLGLPDPVLEYRFAPPRKWRFDYAWPSPQLAVEIEGGVWIRGRHTRGRGFLGDVEKYNEAALRGWRVFRFTPQQLRSMEVHRYVRNVFARQTGIA